MDIDLLLTILEYVGTIAFAISGALLAIENKMDILGDFGLYNSSRRRAIPRYFNWKTYATYV